MRRLPCLPIIGLSLLLMGCFRDADPLDVDTTPLHVHAVVQSGADSATVLLSRPGTDAYAYEPVSGADVYLVHDGTAVLLREHAVGQPCVATFPTPVGDGRGCYSGPLAVPVQGGAVYDLDVRVPGGTRVTGRTTVPYPPQITAPDAGQTYVVECAPPQNNSSCRGPYTREPPYFHSLADVVLEWEESPMATHVQVVFRPRSVVSNGASYAGETCEIFPSTLQQPVIPRGSRLRWPARLIDCRPPIDVIGWDTVHVDAVVAVYDSAYGSYMEAVLNRDAARLKAASAGLSGALGVFGAVSTSVREITIVRAPD